ATHLMAASRSRRSALELQRMLDLGSYRSAWFMCHRIRESMKSVEIGQTGGENEVGERDETVAAFKRLLNAGISMAEFPLDDQYSAQETVARREAALKYMLTIPHQPHKPPRKKQPEKRSVSAA